MMNVVSTLVALHPCGRDEAGEEMKMVKMGSKVTVDLSSAIGMFKIWQVRLQA